MIDSFEAVAVFLFFLPGIVATILYNSIAEINEPSPMQATALTIAFSVIATVLSKSIFHIDVAATVTSSTDATADKLALQALLDSYTGFDALVRTLVACALGLAAAVAHNKSWLYSVAYRLGMTQRTGAIDPWHQVFREYNNKWARIRYKDGSKLIGWIVWYAEDGEKKELFLGDATWHIVQPTGTNPPVAKIKVGGPGVFVSNFDEVLGIDFVN